MAHGSQGSNGCPAKLQPYGYSPLRLRSLLYHKGDERNRPGSPESRKLTDMKVLKLEVCEKCENQTAKKWHNINHVVSFGKFYVIPNTVAFLWPEDKIGTTIEHTLDETFEESEKHPEECFYELYADADDTGRVLRTQSGKITRIAMLAHSEYRDSRRKVKEIIARKKAGRTLKSDRNYLSALLESMEASLRGSERSATTHGGLLSEFLHMNSESRFIEKMKHLFD